MHDKNIINIRLHVLIYLMQNTNFIQIFINSYLLNPMYLYYYSEKSCCSSLGNNTIQIFCRIKIFSMN